MKLYDDAHEGRRQGHQARAEEAEEGRQERRWRMSRRYSMIRAMRTLLALGLLARRPPRRVYADARRLRRGRRAEREEAGQVPHRVHQRQAGHRDRHGRRGVRQGPAPERRLRAHGEEHRLRMGEPEAGLHAAHPRDREESAVLMASATRTASRSSRRARARASCASASCSAARSSRSG